jgi:hypothetical protein
MYVLKKKKKLHAEHETEADDGGEGPTKLEMGERGSRTAFRKGTLTRHFRIFAETPSLSLTQCQSERDELQSRFVSAILELQQKTGLKNALLEKKLEKLYDLWEQREIDERCSDASMDARSSSDKVATTKAEEKSQV